MIDPTHSSLTRLTMSHSAHRIFLNIAGALLIAVGASLILFSPIALEGIATFSGPDWVRLSNIGQTYGAVSAVVSGVALATISASLILQSRELNLSRVQMMRNYHFELIKFGIENPSLLSSWGIAFPDKSSIEDVQRSGFTNMLVVFWKTSYEAKLIDSDELRGNISTMFQGEVGRTYWHSTRDGWIERINNSRTHRFVEIIEEEYRRARDSGPPRVSATLSYDTRLWTRKGTQLLLGFGAGVLAANAVPRNRIPTRSG